MKKIVLLIVENDLTHLRLLADIFRRFSQIGEVLTASSCTEALQIINRSFIDIHLIIADWHLGDGNGGQVIQTAKKLNPMAKCVIMSIDHHIEELAAKFGAVIFIDKRDIADDLDIILPKLFPGQ